MLHPQKAPDGQPSVAGLSMLRCQAFPLGPEDPVTRHQKWLVFQCRTWRQGHLPSWLERFLSGGRRSVRPRATGLLCDQNPGGADRRQWCLSRPSALDSVDSELEGQGPSPLTAVGNAII